MKAIVYTSYGSPEVLQLKEVEKPIPAKNEILIRIKATAVNSGDCRLRAADPFAVRFFFGLFKPKKTILGSVFSGEVEQTGASVTMFKKGDQVFGSSGMRFGAYAQYVSLPETATMALKPEQLSHQEAAVIPFGGNTALHFIKKAGIKPGQKVLIYGASGSVGTAAIQLAKQAGAVVTGVCSTANMSLVKSIGADKVIDYTKEDFSQNGETYDMIMDTVRKMPYKKGLQSLTKNGILILSAAGISEMLKGIWTSLTSSKKVLIGVISENTDGLLFLKNLLESGNYKPVIDKTYKLEQLAEAHAYAEKGHKKGNIAITIE